MTEATEPLARSADAVAARSVSVRSARSRSARRGALAALVSVLLAAVSHTVGGGAAPPAWLLAIALALAWPIATLLSAVLAGARRRRLGLAAPVGATHLVVHAAVTVLGDATPQGAPLGLPLGLQTSAHTGVPSGGLPAVHAHTVLGAFEGASAGSIGAHHALMPSGVMLLSHLVALGATVWLLTHGEALLTRLSTLPARMARVGACFGALLARAVRIAAGAAATAPPRTLAVAHAALLRLRPPPKRLPRRRGPPARFALIALAA